MTCLIEVRRGWGRVVGNPLSVVDGAAARRTGFSFADSVMAIQSQGGGVTENRLFQSVMVLNSAFGVNVKIYEA